MSSAGEAGIFILRQRASSDPELPPDTGGTAYIDPIRFIPLSSGALHAFDNDWGNFRMCDAGNLFHQSWRLRETGNEIVSKHRHGLRARQQVFDVGFPSHIDFVPFVFWPIA